jgi:hypothetical protein
MHSVRVEVTDQHGMVALIIGAPEGLRLVRRERLREIAGRLVTDLAAKLRCDERHALSVALAELTRTVADEEAYERVASRRGLLPL